MVAILEPFIDTILICTLTGLVLLSSGVWNEKIDNRFEQADLEILAGTYDEHDTKNIRLLSRYFSNDTTLQRFEGSLEVEEGVITTAGITILHAESFAEDVRVHVGDELYSGLLAVEKGRPDLSGDNFYLHGKSLIHSAALTTEAFKRSVMGDSGQYIVAIGLLLFAFSTAISWSYYGDRAVTYLWGTKYVICLPDVLRIWVLHRFVYRYHHCLEPVVYHHCADDRSQPGGDTYFAKGY